MACSRLFRGNNQVAALLGSSGASVLDKREMLLENLKAYINGLVVYEMSVQRIITNDLNKKQFDTLKTTDEYKLFKQEFKAFAQIHTNTMGKGESTKLPTTEIEKDVNLVIEASDKLVKRGNALVQRCNEISQKNNTVDFSPAPDIDFPVVCNNEKAPDDIIAWVNRNDDSICDKRVICDIDVSVAARVLSIASEYGNDTVKKTAKAAEASKVGAFHVGLPLSNGFRVYIINGSFVGIGRETLEIIGSTVTSKMGGMIKGATSMMLSCIQYIATQSFRGVMAVGSMGINAIVSLIHVSANNRVVPFLSAGYSKEIADATAYVRESAFWKNFTRNCLIGAATVAFCYLLPIPEVLSAVFGLGQLIAEYCITLPASAGAAILTQGDSISAVLGPSMLFVPYLVQLTTSILIKITEKLGLCPSLFRPLFKLIAKSLMFFLRMYQVLSVGRATSEYFNSLPAGYFASFLPAMLSSAAPHVAGAPLSITLPVNNTRPTIEKPAVITSPVVDGKVVEGVAANLTNDNVYNAVFGPKPLLEDAEMCTSIDKLGDEDFMIFLRKAPLPINKAMAEDIGNRMIACQMLCGSSTAACSDDPQVAYFSETMYSQLQNSSNIIVGQNAGDVTADVVEEFHDASDKLYDFSEMMRSYSQCPVNSKFGDVISGTDTSVISVTAAKVTGLFASLFGIAGAAAKWGYPVYR